MGMTWAVTTKIGHAICNQDRILGVDFRDMGRHN